MAVVSQLAGVVVRFKYLRNGHKEEIRRKKKRIKKKERIKEEEIEENACSFALSPRYFILKD